MGTMNTSNYQKVSQLYASVTFDDDYTLVLEFNSLLDWLPGHVENGGTYIVEHIEMSPEEFEALPEFQG